MLLRSALIAGILTFTTFVIPNKAVVAGSQASPQVPRSMEVSVRPDFLLFLDGRELSGRVTVDFREGILYLNGLRWLPPSTHSGTMRMPDGQVFPIDALTPADSALYPKLPFIAQQLRIGNSLRASVTTYHERVEKMLQDIWSSYQANLSLGDDAAERVALKALDPLLADTSKGTSRTAHVDRDAVVVYLLGRSRMRYAGTPSGPELKSDPTRVSEAEAAAAISEFQEKLSAGKPSVLIYAYGQVLWFTGADLVKEVVDEIRVARRGALPASRGRTGATSVRRLPESVLIDIAEHAQPEGVRFLVGN